MRQTKRIILVGHAASGKDYLANMFTEQGYTKDVSWTTREPRDGETPGYTYEYVSEGKFLDALDHGLFYEHTKHNDWLYGTLEISWMNSDVFIMNPHGVSTIKPEDRRDCIIVYIEIPEDIRRERMDLRSDADTTERRLKVDKEMFKGFIDYDYRINDPFFNANVWIDLLVKAARSKEPIDELSNTER